MSTGKVPWDSKLRSHDPTERAYALWFIWEQCWLYEKVPYSLTSMHFWNNKTRTMGTYLFVHTYLLAVAKTAVHIMPSLVF